MLIGNLIVFLIIGVPLIIFLIQMIIHFNDRLYCKWHNIDYDTVEIVDYGYATVYFTNGEKSSKQKH